MNYIDSGGEINTRNPNITKAIDTCNKGTVAAPYALNNPAILIVLKTLNDTITPQDWNLFHQRLNTVSMSWENQRAPAVFAYYAHQGIPLNKKEMLKAFTELSHRIDIPPYNSASLGYFIMNELNEPDQAMPYFTTALNAANPMDTFPQQLAKELQEKHRPDLAAEVERIWKARLTRSP